jgi:hypothetical protein
MTTISANKLGGIVLNPASYTNPIAIEADVTISSVGVAVAETTGSWTIQNAGVIASGFIGMLIGGGASITNAGTITGSHNGPGTVTNGATISGAAGDAVRFAAGFANLMVVDPGAAFVGNVDGANAVGGTAVSTLELAAGTNALTGIGSNFLNFGSIVFDPTSIWDIRGSTGGLAGGEVISGFAKGDVIDLVGVSETVVSFGAGTLSLDGSAALKLLLPGSFTTGQFHATPNGSDTNIELACFLAGTRILTETGEHEVERLEPGMRVVSLLHRKLLPVVWLGHRQLRASRQPRPAEVWPVRVSAGAFGPGEPHRNLWLSPDHAVFVGGVLIPVRYLINGATIAQECRDKVGYFHVELPEHGVLLAEGLPAESYLDTGNRAAFQNGGGAVLAQPDFAQRVWDAEACAKLVVDGPAVTAVHKRLHARAALLGHASTDDAGLHVIVAGMVLPTEVDGRSWRVQLPPDAGVVRLVSRRWVPAQMCSGEADHRVLGVALARIRLDGRMITVDDPCLSSGWHDCEPSDGGDAAPIWRWTTSDARLALTGVRELAFDVVMGGRYWVAAEAA